MNATILTAQQAANILGLKKSTVLRWACEGKLPAAKVGHKWLFVESDILTWLLNKYIKPMVVDTTKKENSKWHLQNAGKLGTSVLASMEDEYKKALGLPTDNRLRDYTMS